MRYKLYVAVIALGALAGLVANTRLNSIAACSGDGYRDDTYLAYCEAPGYGNFEHGALYLPLEPEAAENLRRADVVMLGNSRTQRAFSTEATEDFFRGIGASFYVAGFGYGENVTFAQALFERLDLRPRAVIVNADPFFDADVSWPARTLLKTENGEDVYADKEAWQDVHREVCGGDAALDWLCGDAPAIFRSVTDGRWHLVDHGTPRPIPIRGNPDDRPGARPAEERERLVARARRFLDLLAEGGVPRDCVLFTVVPSDFATYATARELGRRLGVEVVTAEPAGLATTDHSHLTRASAERWSAALLERAERRLHGCVAGRTVMAGGEARPTAPPAP